MVTKTKAPPTNGHANRVAEQLEAMIGTAKKPAAKSEVATIPTLNIQQFTLQVVGTTPLIVHAFSAESHGALAIEAKQQKKAKTAKQARDPEAEYAECFYMMPGSSPPWTKGARYGIPAAGFKKAAISACRYIDGINMRFASGAFFVLQDGGGNVEMECSEPTRRKDTVRIGNQKNILDIRYRPEFADWKCKLRIRYNAAVISAEQVVNLFHHAGFHIGWGEMRPEKGGYSYGMFEVRTADEEAPKARRSRK